MNFFLKIKHFVILRIRIYLDRQELKIGFWKNIFDRKLDKYFTSVLEKKINNIYLNKNIEQKKKQIELLKEHLNIKQNIYRKYIFLKLLDKNKNNIDKTNNFYIESSLNWLFRGLNNRNLISAAYSCKYGWLPGYPETNGYILETFVDLLEKKYSFKNLEKNTRKIYNNLIDLQDLDKGHFLSGYDGIDPTGFHKKKVPSVFNTSQICLGLIRCYYYFKDEKLLLHIKLCEQYISSCLDDNGNFIRGLSSGPKSKLRSYYVKNSSILIKSGILNKNDQAIELGKKSLNFYSKFILENGWIRDNSFFPNQDPLTHNLAYYTEGYWEAYKLLKDENYLNIALRTIKKISEIFEREKFLFASFSNEWNSSDFFSCTVGLAQFSNLLLEIGHEIEDFTLINTGLKMLDELKKIQYVNYSFLSSNKNIHGALPSSYPIYGNYSMMNLTNWTSKYYIDALKNEDLIFNHTKNEK